MLSNMGLGQEERAAFQQLLWRNWLPSTTGQIPALSPARSDAITDESPAPYPPLPVWQQSTTFPLV